MELIPDVCTAAHLFEFHDKAHLALLLQTGGAPPPSRLAMMDPKNPAGVLVYSLGRAAAAELVEAAAAGGVYDTDRLDQLDAGGAVRLRRLLADLWYCACYARWHPGTSPPGATRGWLAGVPAASNLASGAPRTPAEVRGDLGADDALRRLRAGERLFGDPPGRVRCVVADRSVRLDGKVKASGVDEEVFAYFRALVRAFPARVPFAKLGKYEIVLIGVNQTRVTKKVPPALKKLVSVNGGGHVLSPPTEAGPILSTPRGQTFTVRPQPYPRVATDPTRGNPCPPTPTS